MTENSGYVKEIERYFISLSGEGIMLSSEDYALLINLRDSGVPKEVVQRGISRAFSEEEKKEPSHRKKIRSIKQCSTFIEKSVEEFRPLNERETITNEPSAPTGIVAEAAEKLGELINNETRPTVRDYYINFRNKVLLLENSGEENLLGCIIKLESDCLEQFFSNLPADERDELLNKAKKSVQGRGRYMTDKAFSESVISFRNEIIHNEYKVRSLYGYEQG